jgi:ElaA protein
MITWECKYFNELSAEELYAILRLRSEVFVVEQDCVYLDIDDKDQHSYHFMGWDGTQLAAYTRILPPGLAFAEASIGRVATSARHRGKGIGRELMLRSIEHCTRLFQTPIHIGAQRYLEQFYESLGFKAIGEPYLEDDIPHIGMLREN